MKKVLGIITALAALSLIPALIFGIGMQRLAVKERDHVSAAEAAAEDTILSGISIGPIDVSGLTEEEAEEKVSAYMDSLTAKKVTVNVGDSQEVLAVADTGLAWSNPEVVHDAMLIGKTGNILTRFKEIRDTERDSRVFDLEERIDESAIDGFVSGIVEKYACEPVDGGLVMQADSSFVVTLPEIGLSVDAAGSSAKLREYILHSLDEENPMCTLPTEVLPAKGDPEKLAMVRDVLGRAVTDYSNATPARATNVANGAEKINGVVIEPGDTFSVESALTPFTTENGYEASTTFVNGKTEDDIGGGICQVSSTLYIAALKSELEIVERYNHSMRVNYVDLSMDATISEGFKDLKIRNNLDYPVYIDAHGEYGTLTVQIYGVEERDPGREITFESEVLATVEPQITYLASNSHGIGYVQTEKYAQEGVMAELYRIISENGVEISREKVNTSNYFVQDQTTVVGIYSDNPQASQAMFNAIYAQDINQIYNVINTYGVYQLPADLEAP